MLLGNHRRLSLTCSQCRADTVRGNPRAGGHVLRKAAWGGGCADRIFLGVSLPVIEPRQLAKGSSGTSTIRKPSGGVGYILSFFARTKILATAIEGASAALAGVLDRGALRELLTLRIRRVREKRELVMRFEGTFRRNFTNPIGGAGFWSELEFALIRVTD